MNPRTNPHIVDVERLSTGVVVVFSDGMCALYSDALLYSTLPHAEDITPRPGFFDDDLP